MLRGAAQCELPVWRDVPAISRPLPAGVVLFVHANHGAGRTSASEINQSHNIGRAIRIKTWGIVVESELRNLLQINEQTNVQAG